MNSLNYMMLHGKLAQGAIVLLGAVLTFLYWLLFANVLRVGECRFFLESALYEKTKPGRILFLFKIKRGLHVSKVMLAKALSITLWSITIIGGIYKFYCYRMVSYILAENPEISSKEVFALSTQMMKGNKLKAFLLDLSFLPFNILSVASLGVIGFLFAIRIKRRQPQSCTAFCGKTRSAVPYRFPPC